MKFSKIAFVGGMVTLIAITGCKKTPIGGSSGQIDEICDDKSPCEDDLVCDEGICRKSCQNDTDCAVLNRYCRGGKCLDLPDIPKHKKGEACTAPAACEAGLDCYKNICTKVCQNKEDCGEGYDCEGGHCVEQPAGSCGNGILETGEDCDDHNNDDGDGCSSACALEAGCECSAVTGATSVCSKLCGNGQQNDGEQCDDGNSENNDGCKNDCTIGQNYRCAGWPSVCSCLDGYQDSNSDGLCQADCDSSCSNCVYDDSGLASCRDFQACQDSNNPATCSCVIYVVKDAADGTGAGWESPLGSLDEALALLADKKADSATKAAFNDCWIWLDNDQYEVSATYNLQNVKIAGGFAGNESWLDDRDPNLWSKFIMSSQPWASTGAKRLFNIQGQVTLDRLSIGSNPMLAPGDGAIYGADFTMLRLVQCSVADQINNDKTGGGAAYLTNGRVEIEGCVFKNNGIQGKSSGGALYLDGTSANIVDTVFTGNYISSVTTGVGQGGAIYLKGGNLNLENTKFAVNSISGSGECSGGAIYNDGGKLNGHNLQFINNTINNKTNSSKSYRGGAIYSTGNTSGLSLDDVKFVNNSTGAKANYSHGGSIFNDTPNARLENISISAVAMVQSKQTTQIYGVGIYNQGANLQIMNGIFSNLSISSTVTEPDISTMVGTAIYNDASIGTVKIGYSAFYQNTIRGEVKNFLLNSGTDANGIKAYFCLLDSKTDDNRATFFDSVGDIQLSAKTIEGDRLQLDEADANKTLVKLSSSEKHWQPGELSGQYLYYKDNSANAFSYPILDNGEDYMLIATNENLVGEIPINIIDWHDVAAPDKNDTLGQSNIIDKAGYNDYFDPDRDIFDTGRPQGAANDIGPVEIR